MSIQKKLILKENLQKERRKRESNISSSTFRKNVSMRVIMLENIRSLNNVGAIFRTADGAGFDRVALIGYTPTPPREEISKTALGAEDFVPWEYFVNTKDAIEHYKDQGCIIVALEKNEKSTNLFELPKMESIAVIVGNELE